MSKARDLANAGTALTTVSPTELGYLDGVSSAVQTQINAKLATTTAASTYEPVLPSQTGNSGKYLTTDGSSKSWGTVSSGGMTLIETKTLSGAVSSVSFTSIPTTYKQLRIVYDNVYVDSVVSSSYGYLRVNNNTSDGHTASSLIQGVTTQDPGYSNDLDGTQITYIVYGCPLNNQSANKRARGVIDVYNTDAAAAHPINWSGTGTHLTYGSNATVQGTGVYTGSTPAAVSRLDIGFSESNMRGTFYLYGFK